MGDSASDTSETVLAQRNEDELPYLPDEIVEDLTNNEISDYLSDESSLASLTLDDGTPSIKPRPYQFEMVQESLSKNIIIAMDTGSGKTHCAVMRMQYELERILPDQLIWFLAPTVSLCSQQYEYIESQISAVQIKFLSGTDGVDRWTEQSLWDSILKNVKIVVSTYQILLDALTHAFVRMETLALIVFDEAHNCIGKQAGAKLMQNFYHKRKAQGLSIPHILGLTASPVINSDPLSVIKIEETLDALCRTPKKHREKLRLQVKLPLEAWAADYYASQIIAKVTQSADGSGASVGIWDVTSAEKQYLKKALQSVELSIPTAHKRPTSILPVTDKVRKLVEILAQMSKSATFSGIVFVQERALAAVLAHLLSVHPETRDLFRIGTIVGTSAHSHRAQSKDIRELIDVDSQKKVLSSFKSGQINLVVATSVLEEGIDVPLCNVVVCFQKLANLKSFVQRRGRARQRDSELVLLLDSTDKGTEWHQLELAMRKIYEDEMRVLEEVLLREDAEEAANGTFEIPDTGALLDFDNAVAHLYHFCSTLPSKEYVDLRPEFICFEEGGFVGATVMLPLSVDQEVRTAKSKQLWMSEKNAIKDAAFEAYVALHHAGLVNDNLLPLLRHDSITNELPLSATEKQASILNVREQLSPWYHIARAWEKSGGTEVQQVIITVGDWDIQGYLPISIPEIPPFKLYWDVSTVFLVTTRRERCSTMDYSDIILKTWSHTLAILQSAFGSRFAIQQKRVVMPFMSDLNISRMHQIGRQPVTNDIQSKREPGLIRDKSERQIGCMFREFLSNRPALEHVQSPYENFETASDGPHLALKRLPRRFDFLHKVVPGNTLSSSKPYSTVLPVDKCTEDSIPFKFVQFGIFIPSIMHYFSVYLVAKVSLETLLRKINISNISLIAIAICAPSANEPSNYQRLEFLGDSILKTCTSVQLMGEFPLWHEGYLSAGKDRIVSNSRLSRAAIEASLDSFIITKQFSGQKWRPIYIEDMLSQSENIQRELSSKVVADVVEALIGAAMIFLPEQKWRPLEIRRIHLFEHAPNVDLPATLQPLERLIGYTFKKKALLVEAMTHASYKSGSQSLERLEFLGDAVLDYVVVNAMFREAELSHVEMHHLRTSLVNADYLAFICMEWGIDQEIIDLEPNTSALDENGLPEFKESVRKVSLPLWRFLRHGSPRLAAVQQATSARHVELRGEIMTAFEIGSYYPWALLARLKAQKFFSDMVESLLGAVWIDSGSFEACTEVVECMGILPYFRRILKDKVETIHPKGELGILADSETVRYVISSTIDELGESEEYLCAVFVGDAHIVEVRGGISSEEVKTKAAEMAVKTIKARKSDFEMNIDKVDGETAVDVEMKD
ncbi:P-loop containing nucleoside triphosphate hydrolase protein [Stipitochalara longipes BDJ]|nr:P-loop containing nucleoside triphosphate hydrolase protein [Stipitochalara longipes BDJ]